MDRLEGKTALVTGAARGLGAAIARRFADEGATVIVNDLSLDAARSTAEKLGGHGVAADVSDSASVAAMFAEVERLIPRLDILVNNAGISGLEGRNDVDQLIARRAKLAQELAERRSGHRASSTARRRPPTPTGGACWACTSTAPSSAAGRHSRS